jgi:hypothetical protein
VINLVINSGVIIPSVIIGRVGISVNEYLSLVVPQRPVVVGFIF